MRYLPYSAWVSEAVRIAAMEIVLAEERAAGWTPRALRAAALEKQHGCDILSVPPDGGQPHPVEVKGWGGSFVAARGRFAYTQDIRESQMQAAKRDPRFRIEIVANLTAYIAGTEPYERLTLTAVEIVERAIPRLHDVPLTGKENEIVRRYAPPSAASESGPVVTDAAEPRSSL
jgi:hypothetical protein